MNDTLVNVEQILKAAKTIVELKTEISILEKWMKDLKNLVSCLNSPIEKYPILNFDTDNVKRFLAPENVDDVINKIYHSLKKKYPVSSPAQTGWDLLTRLEENLKAVEKANESIEKSERIFNKAVILSESFQAARDFVLNKLYTEIKDDFVSLYRQLHHSDEKNFTAKLQPAGAGLNFEVDFYGRGAHPPHALHSEGHQDSMGLCLYLVLSEKLLRGKIDLVLLDDVVMSVDAEHRRELCHILATKFPERQFLITTHDKTWATQLKTEGVVDKKGTIEFYNWNINSGPQVNYLVDIWDRIEHDLNNADVPSASAKLRRNAEEFFSMVCDALYAKVPFKLSFRWELGELFNGAYSQYRKFLNDAINAAKSWENEDDINKFVELKSTSDQIYTRTMAEQWGVNATVHYNNWANLNSKDFRPIVEAFQDIYALFVCSRCGSMLKLTRTGLKNTNVRCNCGNENWNLIKKE